MPKSYPHSVRRQISHRVRSGDAFADIATETGISPATLVRWKDPALIDAGARDGVPSIKSDELASARDGCALFDDQSVVPEKEDRDRRRTDRTRTFR